MSRAILFRDWFPNAPTYIYLVLLANMKLPLQTAPPVLLEMWLAHQADETSSSPPPPQVRLNYCTLGWIDLCLF